MPYDIARYIANILNEMQIITNEHDLNCFIDTMIDDVDLRLMLENEFGN